MSNRSWRSRPERRSGGTYTTSLRGTALGLGRATMELLESEVRDRGLENVELNVFGGNEIARKLYRSLGFDERFVQMGKRLR